MDSQSQSESTSTMELYESTAEELSEIRYKYSAAITKYLSEITERDLRRMKKMKFERMHAGIPRTKLNVDVEANYNFSSGNASKQNQCDGLRNEITQLKEKLQRMKAEE